MEISHKFNSGYIDRVFTLWYNMGKPPTLRLHEMIPVDETRGEKPTKSTLREWMNHEKWLTRKDEWDYETDKAVREKAVAAKVEMLERHAEVGREMQSMSLQWLRDNENNLTAGTAVRMLMEGVKIEQGAVGIPDAIKKMQEMDDEKLLKEVAQLIADSESEIDAYN